MGGRLAGLIAALLMLGGVLTAAANAQAAPSWTEIDAVAGQIYDVSADRILFAPQADQLALKDRNTQVVTPIPLSLGHNPEAAFLSPHGAIFMTSDQNAFGARHLYEWRDGATVPLGEVKSGFFVGGRNAWSLTATGDFAIWNSVDDSDPQNATNPLYRRDLASGTTATVTASTSYWTDHDLTTESLRPANDVAANGDVVFSGNGVQRWRNGVTTQLSSGGFAIYPRTDETGTVAWTSANCCPGATAGRQDSPAGSFDLGTLSNKRPSADLDYDTAGGWVAFTDGSHHARTVSVRSPAGVETAVSPPGNYDIVAMNDDGHVIYGTFAHREQATVFLGRPGEDPVELGTLNVRQDVARGYGNHVFAAGDRWYHVDGGSLRRLTLAGGATGGSETTIDTAPDAADNSPSATFEFSSTTPGATFQTRLDGGAWEATASGERTYSGLDDGQHVFLVRAVAPDGSVDPEPASYTWTVDTAAPLLTLESPADDSTTNDSTPELAGDAGAADGDSADVIVKIHEGDSTAAAPLRTTTVPRSGATWSTTATPELPDGLYTAVASQTDDAGNSTTSPPHTFRVDTAQPAPFALVSPADGAQNQSPYPVLSWERTTDAGSGVTRYELWIDGAKDSEITPGSCGSETCGKALTHALAEGAHAWHVKAFDGAGNERSTTTHSFSVEAAPPEPFGLLSPADGQRVGDSGPLLDWEHATDSGSGLDYYRVWLDGAHIASVEEHQFDIPLVLGDGSHSWRIDAVDHGGNVRSSGERSFVVDTTAPVVQLTATPNPVLTGAAVTLDASGSSDPGGGAIVRHEWDLDGDSTFDSDTGRAATATNTFPRRGPRTPVVRVTDEAGNTATASTQVDVRAAPPAGLPGVSIERGARFTDDPRVRVDIVWPPLATAFLISNDGGFPGATPRLVRPRVPWLLDSSGPERLPKTIYLRFEGIDGRETYQDDIILDETAPRLLSARLEPRTRRSARLRLRARDRVSGLARVQLKTHERRAARTVRFRRVITVSAFTPRLLVRVRDRAGNWSKWRRATRG